MSSRTPSIPSNPYLRWLERRLADPSTSTASYTQLRREWEDLCFAQHQVNIISMAKPSRLARSAPSRVSRVHPTIARWPDFADTVQPDAFQ